MDKEKIEQFYKKNYKKLMIIPLVLLLIAFFIIFNQYRITGDIVEKDVTLKGGITATVYSDKKIDVSEVERYLTEKFKGANVLVRKLAEFGTEKQIGIIVEASDISDVDLKNALAEKLGIKLSEENYSVEEMGSSLGEAFYKQMLIAILLAFLFMAIVVFIVFRTFIPSMAVVFAAFSDIVITIAVIDLIGIKLSTAGVAALLLLLGYSVDTDVLLTTRILKRKEGSLFERFTGSMKTGLTMTITTIAALSVAFFVSNSHILRQIFLIVLIGLAIDVISTYLMNAGILRWYCVKKENEY